MKIAPLVAGRYAQRTISLCCTALVGLCWPASAQQVAPDDPAALATLQDKNINECSGLAASRSYPGLFWTHNDSGDTARLFAIDRAGRTVATVSLKGAGATDWEDISLAGEPGNWKIYCGDIGDNTSKRAAVQVYRLAEPALDPNKLDQQFEVEVERCDLEYEGGARDAEALLVEADGHLNIVSKSIFGSGLFRSVGAFASGARLKLERIGNFAPGSLKPQTRLVTGGDFNRDGTRLALVTYTHLYEWALARPYSLAGLDATAAKVRALPRLKQCEAVCYEVEGSKLLVSSEGLNAPLFEVASALP